jgi:hypothetical protein
MRRDEFTLKHAGQYGVAITKSWPPVLCMGMADVGLKVQPAKGQVLSFLTCATSEPLAQALNYGMKPMMTTQT